MSLLATVNGRGTLAARPAAAAANEGYIYWATDSTPPTWYRSNGTSWDAQATSGLADQGTFTFLDGTVAAAPATPAAGKLRLYAKTGKVLAVKDDAGVETVLGAGGGSITRVTADQTADVTLAADTIADATGASISLTAGTWLVFGEMCINTTSASAIYCLMAMTDGANAKVFESRLPVDSSSPVSLSGHAIVAPAATTTYKLRGQAAGGATTKIIKNPEAGTEIGTRISAIKLA